MKEDTVVFFILSIYFEASYTIKKVLNFHFINLSITCKLTISFWIFNFLCPADFEFSWVFFL